MPNENLYNLDTGLVEELSASMGTGGDASVTPGGLAALQADYLKRQAAFDAANKSREDLFEEARKRLQAQRAGPSSAEQLFAIAAALQKPTRTGSFFEAFGNVGGAMSEAEKAKRESMMARDAMLDKYGLAQYESMADFAKAQLGESGDMLRAAIAAQTARGKRRTALSAFDGRVYDLDTGEVVETRVAPDLPTYTPEQAAAAKAAAGGQPIRFRTVEGREMEI